MIQDAAAHMDDRGEAAALRCYRWPDKQVFLSADEASVALRTIFNDRAERGRKHRNTLGVYACDGAEVDGRTVDHWHHGNLPLRQGTIRHPSERRPGRATREPRTRPSGRVSTGLPRRA